MVNMPNLTRTSQRHADLASQVATEHSAALGEADATVGRELEEQAGAPLLNQQQPVLPVLGAAAPATEPAAVPQPPALGGAPALLPEQLSEHHSATVAALQQQLADSHEREAAALQRERAMWQQLADGRAREAAQRERIRELERRAAQLEQQLAVAGVATLPVAEPEARGSANAAVPSAS
jgi:hypothetical protein